MKKWILKAIVQKTISYLPMSRQINYFFQKYVTKGVYLSDEYFYDRLGHAKVHLKTFAQHSQRTIPESCLELGTGWYPIVPISFFLVGVPQTYSVDIEFLTSKERIKTTLEKFVEAEAQGILKDFLAYEKTNFFKIKSLLQNLDTLELSDILQQLHLKYLIEDARHLSLPDNSIDLVNSNNTFEHIYPSILIPILKDFKRVVKKEGGVLSHFIDMSDHFAHFDKSINVYNFLQFSDSQWAWIDNSIQPQSRLRIADYRKIYDDLSIPITTESQRDGDIAALKTIDLAPPFANQALEMVAVSHCHFGSKMG